MSTHAPVLCDLCLSDEDRGNMAICCLCKIGIHVYCMEPMLKDAPIVWTCPKCLAEPKAAKAKIEKGVKASPYNTIKHYDVKPASREKKGMVKREPGPSDSPESKRKRRRVPQVNYATTYANNTTSSSAEEKLLQQAIQNSKMSQIKVDMKEVPLCAVFHPTEEEFKNPIKVTISPINSPC
jgi:hypothetical protein